MDKLDALGFTNIKPAHFAAHLHTAIIKTPVCSSSILFTTLGFHGSIGSRHKVSTAMMVGEGGSAGGVTRLVIEGAHSTQIMQEFYPQQPGPATPR